MQIRRAVAADLPVLPALVEAYWRFEGIAGFDARRIEALLSAVCAEPQRGALWVAESEGAVGGYLLAVYVFSLEQQGLTAEIDELYVAPHCRARGVGSALLMAAESEFRRIGCTSVALQLARDNATAREFYRRHQFAARAGYVLLDKRLQA